MHSQNLKKTLSIIISAFLLASVTVSSVSAAGNTAFTAGDSIAAGVGPVAAGESSFESFSECVGDYLINAGLIDSDSSVAKIGATSAQILDQVKTADGISDAKYIMISSGGNDFLDLLEEAVSSYMDEGDTLAALTPEKTEALAQKISEDQSAFMTKLSEITGVIDSAEKNAHEIVSEVKKKNPDAEIYFLEMFNPFAAYKSDENGTMQIIGSFSENCIADYNSRLTAIEGIKLVPVSANFSGRADDYIRSGDVHPTEAGHIKIAELIISDITGEDNDTILSNMIKYRMINGTTFMALPEDMRSDIDPDKILEETMNAVTTAAVTDAPPVITSVDWTTAVTTTVTSTGTAPAGTTAETTASLSAASGTTVSVKSVSSSPATSGRGISPVIFSGLFASAAACVMLRKKRS